MIRRSIYRYTVNMAWQALETNYWFFHETVKGEGKCTKLYWGTLNPRSKQKLMDDEGFTKTWFFRWKVVDTPTGSITKFKCDVKIKNQLNANLHADLRDKSQQILMAWLKMIKIHHTICTCKCLSLPADGKRDAFQNSASNFFSETVDKCTENEEIIISCYL